MEHAVRHWRARAVRGSIDDRCAQDDFIWNCWRGAARGRVHKETLDNYVAAVFAFIFAFSLTVLSLFGGLLVF